MFAASYGQERWLGNEATFRVWFVASVQFVIGEYWYHGSCQKRLQRVLMLVGIRYSTTPPVIDHVHKHEMFVASY